MQYKFNQRYTYALKELKVHELCDSLKGSANWTWSPDGTLLITCQEPLKGTPSVAYIDGEFHYSFRTRQEYDKAVQIHHTFTKNY